MTTQAMDSNLTLRDNFLIISLYVRNVASAEEVEAIAAWIQPLNDAIVERIVPPNTPRN